MNTALDCPFRRPARLRAPALPRARLLSTLAFTFTLAIAASPDPVKTRELVAVVQSGADLAARALALQQLALVATKDAVPAMARLLADERFNQYARDVLEQIADPSAGAALRSALGSLRGPALIGVVNSLGLRRDPLAVAALGRIAAEATADAAPAALVALGRIGTPEAMRVVEPALRHAAPQIRTAAAEACVLCADRLLAEGQAAAAHRLHDSVRHADVPAAWRVASARGAILADQGKGLALLIEYLRSADPDMRDMALRTARDFRHQSATPALVAELDRMPPPQQAAVISVLVDRGDDVARSALEARAGAGANEVRVAALQALGTVGRASSLSILLAAIRPPSPAAIVDAAFSSLARIPAPEATTAILQAMAAAEPKARARLIGVLGERKAEIATNDLLRLTTDTDLEIAKAAYRALGLVVSPADLPRLIQAAIAVKDEAVKALADRAIATTAMKILEPERRTEAVLHAFRNATDPATKAALLRPLGAIMRTMGGTHEVFFVVRAALKDPAGAVRLAALQCLADWPDATPTMTLLDTANQKDATPAQREIALRGAIRMVTAVAEGRERSPLNLLEALVQANHAVRTKEEKMMIVSGLGSLPRIEAVKMLEPYLDDPDVKSEAALAVVQVASALAGTKHAVASQGVLERIAVGEKDEDVRRQAALLAKGKPVPAAKGKAAPRQAPVTPSAAGRLFNGVSVSDWVGDPAVWRVRDGAIVGGSMLGNPRNEFLATARRYRNFVLRLEYRLVGTEGFINGGVQVRSEWSPESSHEMVGYQADIGGKFTGSLYDEGRRKKTLAQVPLEEVKRLDKRGEWNRYEIRCEGPRVELILNGTRTVEYTEPDRSIGLDGLIGLQIHGGCKAEIAFRNLEIQELP